MDQKGEGIKNGVQNGKIEVVKLGPTLEGYSIKGLSEKLANGAFLPFP